MASDHEKSVIALKQRLHRRGYDKNNVQSTIHRNRTFIPEAVSAIDAHLQALPSCILAKQWKNHLTLYISKDTSTPDGGVSSPVNDGTKRQHHLVVPISDRIAAVRWMQYKVDAERTKGIVVKAIRGLPHLFSGKYKADHAKASLCWNNRDQILAEKQEGCKTGLLGGRTGFGVKRVNFKALPGRGRKRSQWAVPLYKVLHDEFEQL